jgi:hypothetical protein
MDGLTGKTFGNVEVSTGVKWDVEVLKAYRVVVSNIVYVFWNYFTGKYDFNRLKLYVKNRWKRIKMGWEVKKRELEGNRVVWEKDESTGMAVYILRNNNVIWRM